MNRELEDLPPAEHPRSRWQEALDIAFILAPIAISGVARALRAQRRTSERVDPPGSRSELPSFTDVQGEGRR